MFRWAVKLKHSFWRRWAALVCTEFYDGSWSLLHHGCFLSKPKGVVLLHVKLQKQPSSLALSKFAASASYQSLFCCIPIKKKSRVYFFLWGWPELSVQEPTLQEVCDAHPPQWWWNRAQQSSAGCRWNIPWLRVRQKGDKQQHLGNIPLPTYRHHLLSFSKTQTSQPNLHFHSWEWLLN